MPFKLRHSDEKGFSQEKLEEECRGLKTSRVLAYLRDLKISRAGAEWLRELREMEWERPRSGDPCAPW